MAIALYSIASLSFVWMSVMLACCCYERWATKNQTPLSKKSLRENPAVQDLRSKAMIAEVESAKKSRKLGVVTKGAEGNGNEKSDPSRSSDDYSVMKTMEIFK